MAKFDSMPLWIDAYLSDTRHLSTIQHGAYLLLLMEAWRRPNCDLPHDDEILARWAGLSLQDWLAMKGVIMAFWKYDEKHDVFLNKKQKKVRKFVSESSRKQSERATKGWETRKKTYATAYATAMPQGMPDQCRIDASESESESTYSVLPDGNTVAGRPELDLGDHPEPPKKTDANGSEKLRAIDVEKAIFDSGKAILAESGISSKQAGAVIGRWRKRFGDPAVLSALAVAEAKWPSDPVAFIEKTLQYERDKLKESPHERRQTDREDSGTLAAARRILDRIEAGES